MADYGERLLFLYVSCVVMQREDFIVYVLRGLGMTDCSIRRLFKRAISIPYF